MSLRNMSARTSLSYEFCPANRAGLRRSLLLCLAAALVVLLASPVQGQKWLGKKKGDKKDKDSRNEGISLVFTPTTEYGELDPINLTGIGDIEIRVEPFEDSRKEGELIGHNIEDDDPKLVTTPDDVAAFVTETFVEILGRLGLNTVESGGDIVVSGELRRFFVEEDSTYEGDVQIRLTMKRGGKEVYTTMAGGSSTRWGRSYKDENYFETLSDSLIELTHQFVSSPDFRKALGAD